MTIEPESLCVEYRRSGEPSISAVGEADYMIREDCKYWQSSCELCGITGDEKCKKNCKDYESTIDYDDGSDDWD
jgi:hypothetical protein